jgi:hypothetical protein
VCEVGVRRLAPAARAPNAGCGGGAGHAASDSSLAIIPSAHLDRRRAENLNDMESS